MSSQHEERREATQLLIQEARDMLPAVEELHPRWSAASRAVLDRLYVPDIVGGELVVPREHQDDRSIPVMMVSPWGAIHVPGAALTLTARQQLRVAEALRHLGKSSLSAQERIRKINDSLSSAPPRKYVQPIEAQATAQSSTIRVHNDGAMAEIGLRPLVMIRDDLMIAYREKSWMSRFRTAGGIALLHEVMHIDQFETTDAINVYTDVETIQNEQPRRKEGQRLVGELRAHRFQRRLTSQLRDQPATGRYDPDALEEWHGYGKEGIDEMTGLIAKQELYVYV